MGYRNIITSAYGWLGNILKIMTQDEVIDILDRQMSKTSVDLLVMNDWDPTHRVRGRSGRLCPVIIVGHNVPGREDTIAMMKSSELRRIRQSTGNRNIVWCQEVQRQTFKRNVGSFEMESDFDDPDPILKTPSTEKPTTTKPRQHGNTVISCPTEHGRNGKTLKNLQPRCRRRNQKLGRSYLLL